MQDKRSPAPRSWLPGTSHAIASQVAGVLVLVSMTGCGAGPMADPSTSDREVVSVSVTVAVDTLRVAQATRATVVGVNRAGANVPVGTPIWTTGAPAVATVSVFGIVTATGTGSTTVTATVDGKQGQVTVTVIPTPVAVVSVVPVAVSLEPGATYQFQAAALDASGGVLPGRRIEWLSSDPARATVSPTGLVTAVAPGLLSVAAISEGVYATSDVRVSGPPGAVALVDVAPVAATIAIGGTLQLRTTLQDADGNVATDRDVAWRSLDPSVATVSPGGLVTAASSGSAVIEAVSEGHRGTAAITVFDVLDAISVKVADPDTTDIAGDTLTVIAFASGRYPIARIEARVVAVIRDLVFGPVNQRVQGWKGLLDITDLRFGPYQLIVTAFDDRGNRGIMTLAFKRGAREGDGGTKLPPRSK